MSAVLRSISVGEYLSQERRAEFKSEYFQGEVFAMAGGSAVHSLIAVNFIREASNGLKGKPCVVYNSDLRIKVSESGLYTYPDASIICGELEFNDDVRDTVLNPTVIVEVLSDSTESYDRGRKASQYRKIKSLKELVLVSQNEPSVERFIRQDNQGWLLLEEKNLTNTVAFDTIGISIPMAEIYRNVSFERTTKVEPLHRT